MRFQGKLLSKSLDHLADVDGEILQDGDPVLGWSGRFLVPRDCVVDAGLSYLLAMDDGRKVEIVAKRVSLAHQGQTAVSFESSSRLE